MASLVHQTSSRKQSNKRNASTQQSTNAHLSYSDFPSKEARSSEVGTVVAAALNTNPNIDGKVASRETEKSDASPPNFYGENWINTWHHYQPNLNKEYFVDQVVERERENEERWRQGRAQAFHLIHKWICSTTLTKEEKTELLKQVISLRALLLTEQDQEKQ
jgi:hypothetical protein